MSYIKEKKRNLHKYNFEFNDILLEYLRNIHSFSHFIFVKYKKDYYILTKPMITKSTLKTSTATFNAPRDTAIVFLQNFILF